MLPHRLRWDGVRVRGGVWGNRQPHVLSGRQEWDILLVTACARISEEWSTERPGGKDPTPPTAPPDVQGGAPCRSLR